MAYYARAIAYYHTQDYNNSWNDVHKAEEFGGDFGGTQFLEDLKKASGREK